MIKLFFVFCPIEQHRFKAEDKEKHITECESRGTMDRFLYVSSNRTDESQKKPKTPPQVKKRDNEDEESWDHVCLISIDLNKFFIEI